MDESVYYIIPDPTMPPFLTDGFRAYMKKGENGALILPCWRNLQNALNYLNSISNDGSLAVIGSSTYLIKEEYQNKMGRPCPFIIKIMD
jgi:hypothetical protein